MFLSKIILYLKVQLLIFICVQFGCSSMYNVLFDMYSTVYINPLQIPS